MSDVEDLEAPEALVADVTKSTTGSDSPSTDKDDLSKPPLKACEYEYKDFDEQLDRTKADDSNISKRGSRDVLKTFVRGRSFALVPVAISVVWATLAVYISLLLKSRVRQAGCKWFCTPLGLGPTTHSYVGFALFLLMGFRVNESHQRYLDGLKTWTKIEGNVITLSKYILQAFEPDLFHKGDRQRILGWLVAFPVVLKRQLRDERDLRELKHVLAPEDLAQLQNAPNMPYRCLYVLSAYIMKAQSFKKHPIGLLLGLIRWVKELQNCADLCTRIRRTPAAFSYVAHLRTFLFLWLFFLPFTLKRDLSCGSGRAQSIRPLRRPSST